MTITVRAVYEHGVLRPLDPLSLPEGDTVAVTIARVEPDRAGEGPTMTHEADYVQRLRAAGSLDELFEVMKSAPPSPADDDLSEGLDANRRDDGSDRLWPERPWGEGLRHAAGALAEEWTKEDDRILTQIQQDRKQEDRLDPAS